MLELLRMCGEREWEGREIWAREVEGVWDSSEERNVRMQHNKEVMYLAGQAVRKVSRLVGTVIGLGTPKQDVAWTRWIRQVVG